MSNAVHNAKPPTVGVDINEAGRVMAQLDDWRAITFVLVIVLVVILIAFVWTLREARLERREMMQLAQQYTRSSSKVAEALGVLRLEVERMRGKLTHRYTADSERAE